MSAFTTNRCIHWLTYACPVDVDENPIAEAGGRQVIIDALSMACVPLGGEPNLFKWFRVCEELHENGKKHYHALVCFASPRRTTVSSCFDVEGVHPTIMECKKPDVWKRLNYCAKSDDECLDFGEFPPKGKEEKVNHFEVALSHKSLAEALNYLWENEPMRMSTQGEQIKRNLGGRFPSVKLGPSRFDGPWMEIAPEDWNRDQQTLVITGDPGHGKTQWAKYFCDHDGGFFYCKRSLASLKHYKGEPWIIFDDIEVEMYQDKGFRNWACCFDIADGDEVCGPGIRIDAGLTIPPGVKKIWLRNPLQERLKDPYKQVFEDDRRAFCMHFPIMK
jgi:hypothetical protein